MCHAQQWRGSKYKQCSTEDDLCKAFLTISERFLSAASEKMEDELNDAFTDTFWDRLRQNPAKGGHQRTPNVINAWKPRLSNGVAPSLPVAKTIIELKRPPRIDATNGEDDDEKEEPIPEVSPTEHSQERDSRQSMLTFKRSFDSIKDKDDQDGSTAKKQRCQEELPLQNSLLPLYATETLASSSRYYIVGLVIDQFTVTVCYFDRFIVTCVATFSFEDEPSKLALVLYAMNRCDRLRAGFESAGSCPKHLFVQTNPLYFESKLH
ncbi:hypothetical protein NMY22_g18297 [Coprinellus aureogranulatus]|nr:hypothetical protein NMY22_g18297 [Coprinellus aureogranulatus]